MQRPLYQRIATRIVAMANCEENGNNEWYEKHSKALDELERNELPSGSGIDAGCSINREKSNMKRIVIDSSYHAMDAWGFYGRWIDFTVTVKPSLLSGIDLIIKGNFGPDKDLKDNLYDIFDMSLREKGD
jgi:hypothetical protein